MRNTKTEGTYFQGWEESESGEHSVLSSKVGC